MNTGQIVLLIIALLFTSIHKNTLLHSTRSFVIALLFTLIHTHCCYIALNHPSYTVVHLDSQKYTLLHSTYPFVIALLFTSIHTNTLIQHSLICCNTVVHLDSHKYTLLHSTLLSQNGCSPRFTQTHFYTALTHLPQHCHSLCLIQTHTIIALTL